MKISGILFDLEGVLLRAKSQEVLPGAAAIFEFCKHNNLPFGILSNNTVETPQSILNILSSAGLAIADTQLLTPLKFLKSELTSASSALVIGSSTLVDFVAAHNITIKTSSDVELVICGGSYSISNEILYSAFTAITHHNARFITLHKNRVFNDAKGITRPDVGCIVEGLEYSSGKQAKILGKPSADCFAEATKDWGLSPNEILFISDDPISDLEGANQLGFKTGFVHTGKYGAQTAEQLQFKLDMTWPTLVEALNDLI